MSRDILESEMYSAKIYDKEEKLPRTQIIELMMKAKETVMTVVFHKKIDEAYVKEVLEGASKNEFQDAKKLKALSSQLTEGKQIEMTCFLLKSESKLGRSSVMDLNAPWGANFRQIDHRTVESVILKNVKYSVKH